MMRGTGFLRVIGRMKPGMTVEQVRAALPSLEQSYRAHYPTNIDSTAATSVKTLPQDVTENIRAGFATLFAAVCFVLLIACSNVANLLLVRFSGRRREIALRMAIGASRGSIVRLFVWESLLVSVFAGGARRVRSVAACTAGSEDGVEFSSARGKYGQQSVIRGPRFHDWIVHLNGLADGNLPSAAGFPGRFGGRLERRRHAERAAVCGNSVSVNFSSARKSRFRSRCLPALHC